ncbi:MAG: 23S rRNA (adenine(2503)-C(2))-methyltransferase RlmN [Coriobacteriia bacterium]|nr:23S rRNA (adenine(2503)-C(2))-methyltransferase RlmN [Coriobacteriia bacterium]MDI6843179.1 23S rRNA (adenine(2503)-C(2))-methyltransferase RlmN [Anaerosomatales bacterium]
MSRPDITAYDRAGLEHVLAEMGEPRYRARQVVRWLWVRDASSFEEMTDLPAALRTALAERFVIGRLELVALETSRDGTRKYLWRLADGATVESVGIPSGGRLTVCFSTQAGCAMGCAFCATGASGLTRSLHAGEMAAQVAGVARDFRTRASNAVAMGQGEPFANYDATLSALRILNDRDAFGIGARHITVSTCGIIPGIERFSSEPEQFTLAVSLHSAVQETRDRLMPGVRRYPLPALKTALTQYFVRTGRRPTLEVALISGVNDTDEEIAALVEFCSGLHAHVNLIPMNPVGEIALARSTDERIRRALKELTAAGIETSVRTERGADISAACGQLRQRVVGP